jgi:hypothetical protein
LAIGSQSVRPTISHTARPVPNWVFNKLEARGGVGALARFAADLREEREGSASVLDFERVLPTPPDLLAGREDRWAPVRRPDDDDRWFQRRWEHWGTKWNAMWAGLEGVPEDGRLLQPAFAV